MNDRWKGGRGKWEKRGASTKAPPLNDTRQHQSKKKKKGKAEELDSRNQEVRQRARYMGHKMQDQNT